MADLIDRASLIEKLHKRANDWRGTFSGDAYRNAVQMIKKEPAVDAVEVVRCKDCEHSAIHLMDFAISAQSRVATKGATNEKRPSLLAQEALRRIRFRTIPETQCVYAGLRGWMNENTCGVKELVLRVCRRPGTNADLQAWRMRLRGKTRFKPWEKERLVSITGMSCEQLFEEAKNGAE